MSGWHETGECCFDIRLLLAPIVIMLNLVFVLRLKTDVCVILRLAPYIYTLALFHSLCRLIL